MGMNELMHTAAAVLDHVYDGVAAIDDRGKIVYVNPANERITGLKREELVGRQVKDAIPSAHILDVLVTGEPAIGVRTKVGERPVVSNIVPVREAGRLLGVVSVFRDETELHNLARQLSQANETIEQLARLVDPEGRGGMITGESEAMQRALALATKAARVSSPVLIQGESGTGKEVLARYIHDQSPRKSEPFVPINCAAIPEQLLESELFGYEEGAFTGSKKGGRPGLFELADGGTLFLDEVGDMSLHLQAKLLRAIQFQEIRRVGGTGTKQVDVRFLFATHHNLRESVAAGTFREDLYYRMEVVSIHLPSLRERQEDIPVFAVHALSKITKKLGLPPLKIGQSAMQAFRRYAWPGNIRELENVLEQAAILDEDGVIEQNDLPRRFGDRAGRHSEEPICLTCSDAFPTLEEMEEKLLRHALRKYVTKGEAAVALGVSRATLYRKLEKYHLTEDI
ncbi:PAS domain S-box-containing protein [Tumebacillus sp. BK434]|uniref:sigma-54 interaction domain-containing protein n=1 Tax=Tumebacillus sp. BK434 TaxID=2512169 RepID=UPI00104D61B9|nr:sigma 54-interacting transcriptional regulator [Tumebacillus sp. BK434]TCP55470.1 PAS domain S-box-containing protein [Tumebacillus sp. BK434]